MGYRTVDEWENFEFQDADVGQIHMENGHLYLKLGYVTILPDNSCNRDIRKMGTNELTLQLQQVEIDRIIEEGYKLYDADGNFTKSVEDQELTPEEYPKWMEEMAEQSIRSCADRQKESFHMSMKYIWMPMREHIWRKYMPNMMWKYGNGL